MIIINGERMEKLVSVVLPVYNGEKYLRLSIESVLNQTYKNLELIIVNDCSTDSTEEIVLEYKAKDPRIVYIKNEVNSKLPQSLNNGFAVAKGEFFTWTSDDNMYHPDAIEKMVAYMDAYPDTGLVSFDFNNIDEGGQFLGQTTVGDFAQHFYGNSVGACFLYRRAVAKKIGAYDPSRFLVEDYEYWLRVALKFKIDFVHDPIYDYRFHGGSLTSKKQKEVSKALITMKTDYFAEVMQADIPEEAKLSYLQFFVDLAETKAERRKQQAKYSMQYGFYRKVMWQKARRKLFK